MTLTADFFEEEALGLMPQRPAEAHKGCFGHALLVAGSRGKTGCVLLAAKACLRSGVGLLTVYLPKAAELALNIAVPEAMSISEVPAHPADQALGAGAARTGGMTGCAFDAADLRAFTAIGMGPGLGTEPATASFLASLLHTRAPFVLDADALNMLAMDAAMRSVLPPYAILTPHAGEFRRLLLADSSLGAEACLKTREAMVAAAAAYAAEHKVVLVLKGHRTAVCHPDGRVSLNTTGNPGMATAGSGDVLTGVILGLLAQGLSPWDAARLGVWLHGRAGDRAAGVRGQYAVMAGDLEAFL